MTDSRKQKKEHNGEAQDVLFNTWADGYAEVSKMWEDTYLKWQKPWMETTGELVEKAAELQQEASPKQYEDFFDEWMKASQANFGRVFPAPAIEHNKEPLEKLVADSEKTIKLYKSWIANLEENAKKTTAALKGQADPEEYKERYESWMKTYENIFDELLEFQSMESTKEILEKYTGVPDIYFGSFTQIAKLWQESYAKLYEPWIGAVSKLSQKTAELTGPQAKPENYQEFYELWMETYRETYGKYVESMQPNAADFKNFANSTEVYLNMYKSWIAALEKMAEKTNQLSEETDDQDISSEFYGLWMQMYEKAFGTFFEDMPVAGPMKEMMEPVKTMAEINTHTYAKMSKMWAKNFRPTENR